MKNISLLLLLTIMTTNIVSAAGQGFPEAVAEVLRTKPQSDGTGIVARLMDFFPPGEHIEAAEARLQKEGFDVRRLTSKEKSFLFASKKVKQRHLLGYHGYTELRVIIYTEGDLTESVEAKYFWHTT
jgi:hypothetical protein